MVPEIRATHRRRYAIFDRLRPQKPPLTGSTAPVTNDEFTQTLGRVLRRPTLIPTPLLPLRARYGSELVQHLLVEGQRVLPKRLEATGYRFAHPTLEEGLRAALDRHRRRHEP